tara:strand:- start:97 stop:294 length:198 start_codon:yes stop_codon:yes gene_type:complete
MIEQKTFKVQISREFSYEYEVKANNEDDAIQKAYDDWDGETDDVELIEKECYQADCMDSEEIKND